jgi:hypothetical protein
MSNQEIVNDKSELELQNLRAWTWQRVAARLYMELHPETSYDRVMFNLHMMFLQIHVQGWNAEQDELL